MDVQISIRRRGLVKKNVNVDYEVWKWKENQEQLRGGATCVTKKEVQDFAIEAYKRAGISNFKASDGWYRRWKVRWRLPSVVKFMDKSTREDTNPSIDQSKIFIEKDVEANIKEHNSQEGVSLLKKYKNETNCDIKLDNSLHSQTEHNQLTPPDSNLIFECSGKLGQREIDNTMNIYLNQSETKILTPESVCSTYNNISSNDNKGNILSIKKQISADICIEEESKSEESLFNTTFLVNSTNEMFGIGSHSDVPNIDVFDSNSVAEKLIKNNEKIINTSDLLEPQIVHSKSEASNKRTGKNLCLIPGKTFSDELTNHLHIYNNFNFKIKDTELQSNNISLSTFNCSSSELYHVTSSLFDRDAFEDHDLFCDSCEDFHPRTQALQKCCHKQKKELSIKENSLLTCVLEKNYLDRAGFNMLSYNEKSQNKLIDTLSDNDIRLKSPSKVISKSRRYLIQFKNKVVNYALNYNVKQASVKFNLNRGTVSDWLSEHKRLSGEESTNWPENKTSTTSGDCEFLKWLKDSKFNLTHEHIKQRTIEWLEKNGNSTNCQWLQMYAHRLNGTEDSSIRKRYIAYPDAFKQIAVFHAHTHSVLAASRVFGVARRRIREWTQISDRTKKEESGVPVANNVTNETVDKQLFEWYKSQEVIPSSKQIRCKAVEMFRAAGHEKIQCGFHWYYSWRARHQLPPPNKELYNDSRLISWALSQLDRNQTVTHSSLTAQAIALGYPHVSRGWTFRFCKRYHKLLMALPEYTTPLPPAMELQVLKYREHLQNLVKSFNFSDIKIIAMDEIPLQFFPKGQGKKSLLVRRAGFDSCQASLVVSCLSNGSLLPSLFVFKGAVPNCNSDPHVVTAATETGTITEDIMLTWLTEVCFKQLQDAGGLLITDCFNVHSTHRIQQVLKERQVHHKIIPEGCAFKLLPVIKVCMLFKNMVEELCQMSLANQLTALKTPSPDQFYHWSVQVHKKLIKQQKENLQMLFKEMLFG